jgi:hypothetical protein
MTSLPTGKPAILFYCLLLFVLVLYFIKDFLSAPSMTSLDAVRQDSNLLPPVLVIHANNKIEVTLTVGESVQKRMLSLITKKTVGNKTVYVTIMQASGSDVNMHDRGDGDVTKPQINTKYDGDVTKTQINTMYDGDVTKTQINTMYDHDHFRDVKSQDDVILHPCYQCTEVTENALRGHWEKTEQLTKKQLQNMFLTYGRV